MRSRVVKCGIVGTLLAAAMGFAPAARAQPCTYDQLVAGGCALPNPVAPLDPALQPMFRNELPQPVFFTPDVSGGVFDYYEIFSAEADLGLANPKFPFDAGSVSAAVTRGDTWDPLLPTKRVWLGLVDPVLGTPLHTEVWGYGQGNMGGGLLGAVAGTPVSTYPAMSFRATKGRPVKVMWQNRLPNVHMFCKKPMDSNYPCGIDRTLMGTLGVAPYTVGPYGGTQQPDNAMVVHLHGGEIPPDSDGFAELWFGNVATAGAYAAPLPGATPDGTQNIDPHWMGSYGAIQPASPPGPPLWNGNSTATGDPAGTVLGSLIRPTGDSMIYNYPMVQDAATIWYHDHALGKTRVNVAAGPAGYFYVQDPDVEPFLWGNTSDGLHACDPIKAAAAGVTCPLNPTYFFGDCSNLGILAGNCRDVPVVLQDRAFNADGSINFPNALGQAAPVGLNPLAPGPNPNIHPQWVPEYFGDVSVVNGITWPKLTVRPQAYRVRFLDGSNARCYTLTLQAKPPKGIKLPTRSHPFWVIASDQGYLPQPMSLRTFSICPGERYEAVIDFSGFPDGTIVKLQNAGGAPFPNGITPQMLGSPFLWLDTMMQFHVKYAGTTPAAPWEPPQAWGKAVGEPLNLRIQALTALGPPVPNPNFFILNEVLDPVTQTPLRVQIDGKRFEDAVSEMPKRGEIQYWDIINTTVDTHPMHLHLVQFAVLERWSLDMVGLQAALDAAGFPTVNKALVDPWAFALLKLPTDPTESGFKDTAKANPGELLRIVAKWDGGWADQDPVDAALTPFGKNAPLCEAPLATDVVNNAGCRCVQIIDPAGIIPPACGATIYKPYFQPVTSGPYVWHCHIVDHEDNEMMRPTLVVP